MVVCAFAYSRRSVAAAAAPLLRYNSQIPLHGHGHGLFCGETPLGPCGSVRVRVRVRVVEFSYNAAVHTEKRASSLC